MDIVFIVIVLLKLYTAGLTLSWYVMHRGAVKRYALAASLMYAFCNYALVTGLEFYQHLNGFLWLALTRFMRLRAVTGTEELYGRCCFRCFFWLSTDSIIYT